MICDKQLLQILEELGKNSRKVKSLVASEDDTRCAKTLRNIIEGNQKSLAAAAPNPSHNVNRVKVLYNFVIKNHKL